MKYFRIRYGVLGFIGLLFMTGGLFRWVHGPIDIRDVEFLAGSFSVPCLWQSLVGWECLFCGMTRSIVSIFLWSPGLSFYFHPAGFLIVFMGLSFLSGYGVRNLILQWCREKRVGLILVLTAWMVLRNF